MKFNKLFSNFKPKWQSQKMGVRSLDLSWDAMKYFIMTQVIAGLAVFVILRFVNIGMMTMNAAAFGIAFLIFIMEILCAIYINHEFNENSLRFRLDKIIENTDTGVMQELHNLLKTLDEKGWNQ